MPDKITYYAVIGDGRGIETPFGLVRRLVFDGGDFTDEGLRRDFSWKFTPAIVEWERGDFTYDLVEVSHERASMIVEHFREKWGPFGQSVRS
jgi:hypothetical protein